MFHGRSFDYEFVRVTREQ